MPSCANPGITAGGLVGDCKSEYFDRMGPRAHARIAPYVLLCGHGATSLTNALKAMREHGLMFPVVAKPDLGWCGYGVRRINTTTELQSYLTQFPAGAALLLQRYLSEPGEAGIFYMREPGQVTGRIVGLLLRHHPQVVGDGKRTIAQLLDDDPRLRHRFRHHLNCDHHNVATIPRAGERVRLSTIGSFRVGATYEDGIRHQSDILTATVDSIACDMPQFHAGRLDVRFASIHALRRGQFTIMEVNGAGSEAGQAWDPKYTLRQAYRIVFAKQRMLFALGAINRARGHRPIRLTALVRHWLHQQAILRHYPASN
ncbi:hypothetical protein LF63_0114730 [Oleiagrimonas soli]|uniref:ATP-grasp domain-containing protein n=1 Tax=Oleiagrimonas soli TaxID=1543381 RepID=A0A099CS47_9GAMM|nr:hypothetical protein LF63_0114730 [Oleiagrimonas soli]